MARVVLNKDGSVGYRTVKQTAFVFKTGAHSTPALREEQHKAIGDIYPWGDANTLPQEIIKDVEKNTIIPSTLSWKAEALYGSGVGYGLVELSAEKEKLIPADPKLYPEVDAFVNSRMTRRYVRQAAKAYYWWKIIFPEVILSKSRRRIVSLASQRPEYTRFRRENSTETIRSVVINANWDLSETKADSEYSTTVPLINPYADPIDFLKSRKGYKYIYPVDDPSPGRSLYPKAEWHTVRESGWLKVAEEIPTFKKALFENQITIKYLIEVSTWWWNWKYRGFDDYPVEKKKQLMNEELEKFTDFMTGSAAAGNALMVTFHSDPQLQKNYEGWKITPIDNKIADGIYIEDSQEANSHIMYALGVDPVLRGFTPGAKLTSGGSEKRVAWNNYLLTTKPHQDDILEVLTFIRDYNGWDRNIKFWFKNYYQATLDVAKEPQQQAS